MAYQLLAARLASCLGDVLSGGSLSEDAAEALLRGALLECLGPLAGTTPEAAVVIEMVSADRKPGSRPCARVRVTPEIRLEGRRPEFLFELPIAPAGPTGARG